MVEVGMKAGRLSLGLASDKASGNSTNINIQQTAATGGGDVEVTQTTSMSKGTPKEETEYLSSIIHILDKSGALDKAKSEAIDATFKEVEYVEDAVKGT
ncbi:hypothetical protein D3C79_1008670 [compost metagenome]